MGRRTYPILIASLLAAAVGCGKKDKKSDEQQESQIEGFHYGTIILTSDQMIEGASLSETEPEDCGFSLDIYRGEGSCLTPMQVTGSASRIDFMADSTKGLPYEQGSVRILGSDESEEAEGEIITDKVFDFADTSTSLVGNNTLWEQYSYKTAMEYAVTQMMYAKTKFKVKEKYVTMLLAAFDQPFADSDVVSSCVPEADRGQDRYKNADVLEGMTFKLGDYLFCVKDTAEAECAAEDYQWLDLTSSTLVSTRPSKPRQHSYIVNDGAECSQEGEGRYGFNFPVLNSAAKVAGGKKIQLWADWSHGELSKQWAGASTPLNKGEEGQPYLVYYYKNAAGNTVSGTNLKVTLNFDASDMLFIEDLRASDVETSSLETVLKKISTKQEWVFKKKAAGKVEGGGPEQFWSMRVTPEIELTGGTDAPTAIE